MSSLMPGGRWTEPVLEQEVEVPVPGGVMGAHVARPLRPLGLVVIANPSAISHLGRSERFVASSLVRAGLMTCSLDLLTEDEDVARAGAADDVPLLAERLHRATRWLRHKGPARGLPFGYLGQGPAAAAALIVSALDPDGASAIVSRDGSPAQAGAALLLSRAPTLFLVAGDCPARLSETGSLCGPRGMSRLEVLPATPPEAALDRVVAASTAWFLRWLTPAPATQALHRLRAAQPGCAPSLRADFPEAR